MTSLIARRGVRSLQHTTTRSLSTTPTSSISITSTLLPSSRTVSPPLYQTLNFSTSHSLRSSSSHGEEDHDHYDPPGGWLWGRNPAEKHEKEDWENIWTYGFFGAMVFLVVGYCYKPDTRYVFDTL